METWVLDTIEALVQEIKAKLWFNREENDWTVEVDGVRHEHVSAKTVDELFEYAMVAAQQALLKQVSIESKVKKAPN